jgi:hypothetical protein
LLDFLVDGGDSGVHAADSVAASLAKAQAGRALQFCKEGSQFRRSRREEALINEESRVRNVGI